MKTKAIFNWSGGKDSALALYKIQQVGEYEIIGLLTSINKEHQRISMHGVRVALLEQQAAAIGLPLIKMELPEHPTMADYESIMRQTLKGFMDKGAAVAIFGDIFLEDLRTYREEKLAEVNLKGVFPLWKIPTGQLIQEFISLGFKTVVTCINDQFLNKDFAGRIINQGFLNDLPENVDPCGENGEFHTFVFEGPIFKKPIGFKVGDKVYKKYEPATQDKSDTSYDCGADEEAVEKPFNAGFWYCDLIPDES